MRRRLQIPILAFALALPLAAQEPADACEPLLAASSSRPAWPGIVLDVPSGDTLIVQLKDIGRRRIRLAGLRAPAGKEPLASVSRFHLARMAKGLRIFVVLDPPWKTWPQEVNAVVEDFTEAQLAAGLGRFAESEADLLGPYLLCRCQRAEANAKQNGLGLWPKP